MRFELRCQLTDISEDNSNAKTLGQAPCKTSRYSDSLYLIFIKTCQERHHYCLTASFVKQKQRETNNLPKGL